MQDVMNPLLQIQMQYGTVISCPFHPCQFPVRSGLEDRPGLGSSRTEVPFSQMRSQPDQKAAQNIDIYKEKIIEK
jgi:nitrite reductase/ring-hydroxylating ferredoxin subunit